MTAELAAPPVLSSGEHALYLDFDGTFVEFAPEPHLVKLFPGSLKLLTALRDHLDGALAIVTGRRLQDIDAFLAPLELPVAALHGQVMRSFGGPAQMLPLSDQMETARRRIGELIGENDPVMVEDKGAAIVLHYRLVPDQKERVEEIAESVTKDLGELHSVPGHFISEIRQRGISKAEAVVALGLQEPFAGRIPVFVGDDRTDEDGFRGAALNGGFGVKVGEGATAAKYRLADPSAVHAWLRSIVAG
ncbi:trehalose 6-phosphatase [Faunimonas pinastri]|uniref:Trehalose 6-phosphate phosphatase n=1 Tax=Faunimonas pinastri TaxID=1855383 RepID=A0A1H9NSA0_9HYPH|nr:trehalose-phosphatase [Faunimonas pinastri]SER38840.1 trehalose 6-phosphatase [Faunimonas pinastri]